MPAHIASDRETHLDVVEHVEEPAQSSGREELQMSCVGLGCRPAR